MSPAIKWVLNIVAFLAFSANPAAASEPLTLVADEWPPFSGSELPGQGLSMDVTRAVLERAGYDVKTAILPWARVMNGARTGEYDIITSLPPSDDLEELLNHSEPFYSTEVKFIQQKGGDIAFRGIE